MTPLPPPTSATDPAALEDESLVCPHCGYDLRAAPAGGRCSECGDVFDPAELRTSGFPWAHRHERGRIRAYLHTVWLVTIGSRSIAHEASRPQRGGDGRSFRRVTGALVATGAFGVFFTAVVGFEGFQFLAVQQSDFRQLRPTERWLQDVAVPWSAAATLPPVIPLMLIGLAFALTSAHGRLFKLKDVPAARQQRADALAGYAIAPMFWLLPASAWGGVMLAIVFRDAHDSPFGWLLLWLLLALGFLGSILRVTQWSMRIRYAGWDRALLDVPRLVGLWLWNVLFFLVVLPWCIGLAWFIIDSFL